MLRKTALVTAMLGAFASQAFAMGLGEIRLHSALNQPLHAEIELLSPTAADLNDLRAALASNEAYTKAGVERAFFHTKMRFEVVKRADGSAAIKITSREPVREPYLDFLLEATWGSGQVLREYTVLVDPPVLMPAPAPEIEAPAMAAPEPAMPAYRGGASGLVDGEYHVGSGDTAWRVANAVRQDSSVSVEQVMIGLLRANPQAFINQNINKLKAGQILRVPSREEMAAVSHAEALAEVRAQKNQWRGGGTVAAAPAKVAPPAAEAAETPAAAPASTAPAQPSEVDAQLKLVAPKTEEADTSKAAADGGQNVGAMRKELTLAVEAVEAQRLENQELNTRLKQLEDQITQLHRLIELKNTEMAQLSGSTPPAEAGAVPPAPEAPATAPAEADAAPESAAAPEAAMEAQPQPEEPAPEMAPSPPVPGTTVPGPAAQAPKVQPKQTVEDEGLSLANPLVKWGVAGGAIVVALLAWMGARRRRMDDTDFQESILAERHPGGAKVAATAAPAAAAATTAAAAVSEPVSETPAKDAPQSDSSLFTDFAVSDMGAIHNDAEADPIAEADVYLAYGRYQQAEELIRSALNRSPQRNELRFKLLEVLFAAKNTHAFDTESEALLLSLGGQDDELWQRVAEMGQELNPGNPLYRTGSAATPTAATDTSLDFDLGGMQADASPAAAAHDDNSLDFDLGELASFAPQSQEAAPSMPVDEDFNFGLGVADDLEDAGEGVLATADEVATKLDLARAYIEMGDPDGARSILQEVLEEGNATQKSEAQTLLSQMG